MNTKLLLFLVVASCVLFTDARSISRQNADAVEGNLRKGVRNDADRGEYPAKKDESTGADTQDGMVIARTIIHRMRPTKNKVEQTAPNFSLTARGILGKVTSSVSSASNKAKETANKAKAKVEELGKKAKGAIEEGKKKVGSITGKRKFVDTLLTARGILDKAKSSLSSASNKAKETANKAKAKVEELGEKAKGAVEEGKKKVGSITGKREFEAFLETSMGTREESSFLSVMRLEKRAHPLVKTSSSGNEIVLNLCKFSNLRMRCDKEDGNIRRGNVNGKAHILQLKNRLETIKPVEQILKTKCQIDQERGLRLANS
ncbi:unnamed protein product [Pocillopora meandrina]|uniref:Uncharacterized protein n=1 Tax=Pocillopora meandrina TaxID=46732 RepID=A0AAU9VXH8_9CNID|nr:unnamed protein product [Pocillopora meandrina]